MCRSRWPACLQGSQDAVMVLERRNDMMGRFMGYTVVQANHQAHRLFRTDGLPLVGQLLKDVVPEGEHGNFHQRVRLAAESGQAQVDEQARPSPERSSRQRWLHHQIIPLPSGMALISRDTTEVHESMQALREQETFYRSAVDSLPMALYARSARAHNKGRYIVWNRQASDIMQMPAEQVLGRRASDVMPAEIAQRGDAQDQQVLDDPRTHFFPNLVFRTPQGERLIDLIKAPVYGVDGQLDPSLSIATDVTESRRAAEQLKLASRVMEETADAVVVSDALDRIVMVNPAFLKMMGLSRAAGDRLLIEVATRLESSVRDTDCVCRLAGDEFTVILEGAGHPTEVHRIGQRILDRLGQPCVIGNETVWPGASIGATLFEAQDTHDSLCQRADAAMYTAKRAGKARFVLAGEEVAPHHPPSVQQACA